MKKKWPLWPQIDLWPYNTGRGSQAYVYAWVLWSSYLIWRSYSIFGENYLLTPMTQNIPGWIFKTHYFDRGYLADANVWVTWPYHVICSRNSIFSENEQLTGVTPTWPLIPGWSHNMLRQGRACLGRGEDSCDQVCLKLVEECRRCKCSSTIHASNINTGQGLCPSYCVCCDI